MTSSGIPGIVGLEGVPGLKHRSAGVVREPETQLLLAGDTDWRTETLDGLDDLWPLIRGIGAGRRRAFWPDAGPDLTRQLRVIEWDASNVPAMYVMTNDNFVGADAVETGANGGLLGNGSTKQLRWTNGAGWSWTANNIPVGDTSVMVYNRNAPSDSAYRMFFGAGAGTGMHKQFGSNNGPFGYLDNGFTLQVTAPGGLAATTGTLAIEAVSASDLRLYRNGVQIGSTQTATRTEASDSRVLALFSRGGLSYHNGRLAGAWIGPALGADAQADFHAAMLAFQTAMGRNV